MPPKEDKAVTIALPEILLPLMVSSVAFAIRFVGMMGRLASSIPWIYCHADEVRYINAGILYVNAIMSGDFNAVVGSGWQYQSGHPPIAKYLIGFSLWMAGIRSGYWIDSLPSSEVFFYARLPILLISALTCVPTYYLGKAIKDWKTGLIASMFFAFEPISMAFGQLAMLDSPMMFFMALSILCFYHGERSHQLKYVWGGGLLFGMALATKFPALIVVPVIPLWFCLTYYFSIQKIPLLDLGSYHQIREWYGKLLKFLVSAFLLGFAAFVLVWPWVYRETYARISLIFMKYQVVHGGGIGSSVLEWAFVFSRNWTLPEIVLTMTGTLFLSYRFLKGDTNHGERLTFIWFTGSLAFLLLFVRSTFPHMTYMLTAPVSLVMASYASHYVEKVGSKIRWGFPISALLLQFACIFPFYPSFRYGVSALPSLLLNQMGLLVLVESLAVAFMSLYIYAYRAAFFKVSQAFFNTIKVAAKRTKGTL